MARYIKLSTSLTDVTSFSGNFDNIELSARPEFTGMSDLTLTVGFSSSKVLEGYNFLSLKSIMLSTQGNARIFSDDSLTLSAYNFYNELTSVSTNLTPSSTISASYPEVSGYPLSSFTNTRDNTLIITLPAITSISGVDIIAINDAGYGIFSQDSGISITFN